MSISQNFPSTRPSLLLDFAKSKKLDSRITFTRGSTGTYTDDNGLVRTAGINEPRFDHNPSTLESLGLLIEESGTNLILQSEAFNTTWSNTNTTITANAIVAPDGATTADLVDNTGQVVSLLAQNVTVSASSTNDYYVTIFAKKGTSDGFTLNCYYVGNTEDNVTFNFTTGTVSGVPYSGEYVFREYPNGWYRCGFRMTRDSTGTRTTIAFRIWESIRANTSGSTYFWGAQMESKSFPTSYIPTVASTVTRSIDVANITGTNFSNFYNQVEGTLFTNAVYNGTPISGAVNRSSASITGNVGFIWQFWWESTGGGATLGYNGSSYDLDVRGSSISINTSHKLIVAYKTNDCAFSQNGGTVATDTSATINADKTTLRIGDLDGNHPISGRISQLIYYPVRLPNAQLQALTK